MQTPTHRRLLNVCCRWLLILKSRLRPSRLWLRRCFIGCICWIEQPCGNRSLLSRQSQCPQKFIEVFSFVTRRRRWMLFIMGSGSCLKIYKICPEKLFFTSFYFSVSLLHTSHIIYYSWRPPLPTISLRVNILLQALQAPLCFIGAGRRWLVLRCDGQNGRPWPSKVRWICCVKFVGQGIFLGLVLFRPWSLLLAVNFCSGSLMLFLSLLCRWCLVLSALRLRQLYNFYGWVSWGFGGGGGEDEVGSWLRSRRNCSRLPVQQ